MSQTYNLCCRTCKEHIWIGQGSPATLYFYDGAEKTVQAFNIFLRRHLSSWPNSEDYYYGDEKIHHELVLLESQSVPEDWTEVHNVYGDEDPEPDWGKWITYDVNEPYGEKRP